MLDERHRSCDSRVTEWHPTQPSLEMLEVEQMSIGSESRMPVLRAKSGASALESLHDYLTGNSGALLDLLSVNGALLIRGAPVEDSTALEALWRDTCLAAWDGYRFMESTRKAVGNKTVSSNYSQTSAQRFGPIRFHQENHFLPRSLSPDWLLFCCLRSPRRGGETALINTAGAFQSLSAPLQEKLRAHATTTTLRVSSAMWAANFGSTFDRENIEREAAHHGVEIRKVRRDAVWIRYRRPYVEEHPRSHKSTLHYERHLLGLPAPGSLYLDAFRAHNIEALGALSLRERWNRWFRSSSAHLLGYRRLAYLRLTTREQAELYDAWARHIMAIRYELGDILIIDNVIIEHTALAWEGPRELGIMMGKYRY